MTKNEIKNLAKSDGIIISYSGKDKIAYFTFIEAVKAKNVNGYKLLLSSIGYSIKINS